MQVFLSHSGKDGPLARWVQASCAALGIVAYMHEDDPQPGRQLSDKLRSRIRESRALFVLLTPEALDTPTVQAEIGVARERGMQIVPLVQKGVRPEEQAFLQGLEWVEFDLADPPAAARAMNAAFGRLSGQFQRDAMLLGVGLLILAGLLLYLGTTE